MTNDPVDRRYCAMNHLIVYTHPNPASFNHAIMEVYTLELEAKGRDARIRDL